MKSLHALRNPRTWVAACVAVIVLDALGTLFGIFAPAWAIGRFLAEQSSFFGHIRAGLPFYLCQIAAGTRLTLTELHWRLFTSCLFSAAWLTLSCFLWRYRPWARTTLFVLIALVSLDNAVYVALVAPRGILSGSPDWEALLITGLLLFVFTRPSVVTLFTRTRAA